MDNSHCRVCLLKIIKNPQSAYKRIKGVSVKEQLEYVAGIIIERNDNFSKMLCRACSDDTNIAYDLKQRCLASDAVLKDSIEIGDISVNIKEEPDFEKIIIKTEVDDGEMVQQVTCDTFGSVAEFNYDSDDSRERLKDISDSATVERLQCDSCNHTFSTLQKVEAHMKSKHLEKISKFDCCDCTKIYSTKYKLLNHRRSQHPDTLNDFEADWVERQRTRRIIKQPEPANNELVACEICGGMYRPNSMYDHIKRVHERSLKFECDYCGKSHYDKYSLKSHIIRHIPKTLREKPFECDICFKTFCTMKIMNKHKKFAHSNKNDRITCHCGKSFRTQTLYRNHIKHVHQREDHEMPCKLCNKVLSSSTALKQHIRIFHTEGVQNNFMCNLCGRRYYSQGDLNTHTKTSHEEKRFPCDVPGCKRKFATRSNLTDHKKHFHLNQRDFKCSYVECGKSYFTSQKLKVHVLITHEKFRIDCPVGNGCKFSVGRRDYMRNHLRKHKDLSTAVLETYLERLKDMELV